MKRKILINVKNIGPCSLIMIISLLSGMCCGLVSHNVGLSLYVCASALIFLPVLKEPAWLSLVWSSACSAILVTLSCLHLVPVVTLTGSVLMLAFLMHRTYIRYRTVTGLFAYDAPLIAMEQQIRMIYAMVLQLYGMLLLFLSQMSVMSLVVSACLLSLYAAMMIKVHSGKVMLFASDMEERVRDSIRGHVIGPDSNARKDEESRRYDEIAMEILDHFDRDKPYLKPGYAMEDLMAAVGSNRNYTSKAINEKFGCNFSRFINKYRVEHAARLLESSPHMKKSEVALKSGFGNVVSFNTTFKAVKGLTPGEYQDEFLSRKRAGRL